MKISKKRLLGEIQAKGGNLSEIARAHKMTYAGVLKRVKEDSELTAALEETRENLVDLAQSQLVAAVQEGAAWAVKFTLETWGKSRGFTKHADEIKQEPQGRIVLYLPDNGRRIDAQS